MGRRPPGSSLFPSAAIFLPQASVAVTLDGSGAGICEAHCTVTAAGQVSVGLTVLLTVIDCEQETDRPHAFVTLYVRVITAGQVPKGESLTKTAVRVLPQASVAVTLATSGAGTWVAHCTVVAAGQVSVGLTVLLTVIVCVQVLDRPQASVAL